MAAYHHPRFAGQYDQLAEAADRGEVSMEVFGEVTALLGALEDFGHDIEGDEPDDASHRIVSSRYELFALRRTPPTTHTPYAVDRPVIRIVYAWCEEPDGSETPVVMLMGDKSSLGNTWYDGVVAQVEGTMIGDWDRRNPQRKIQRRRQ